MMPRHATASWRGPILAMAALVLLFLGMQWLPAAVQHRLLREHGPIEMLTVVGYAGAALAFALTAGRHALQRHWYFPAIIVAMGLRELDFDKRFTTMGILKSGFYLGTEVPLAEKLAGLLVVGMVACAVLLALRRHGRQFVRGLRALRPDACAIGLAIAFAVVSKSIDGLARKLAGIGIAVDEGVAAQAYLAEELLELGIPLMLAAAIWSRWRERADTA